MDITSEELRRLKDKGPYEYILDTNATMYDKLPYKRDIALCGPDSLVLVSGNVIKYYRYNLIDVFNIMPDKKEFAKQTLR